MRIVFFGTPEFAVHSLQALIDAGVNVVAVVTAPDKPAGRGMNLQSSAVKICAVKNSIPVLQPIKLKDPDFVKELASYQADLQIVIAFRMLPEIVWNMPPKGTMNLHASLLPDYRGAAPINWAIINGETKSGVCTFFLKHEIDTGDILLSREVTITPTMLAGELHDILMHTGAELVIESVRKVESGHYAGIPQSSSSNKIAPKIFKEHCLIHFNQPAEKVYNLIRGMSPYPAAYFQLNGKNMKVFKAEIVKSNRVLEAGSIESDGKTFLQIHCADDDIRLLEVQPESKKRMSIEDFLRGNKV
ncbi:MAG: methionyl-tRNA formyltransferase [Bacteroidia bacterium]